jgi:hypothetical protein
MALKKLFFSVGFSCLTLTTMAQSGGFGNDNFASARRKSGYMNISEVGYATGVDGSANALTISTVNGFRAGDHVSAGLGVAYLRFSKGPNNVGNFLPIFADLRAYIGGRTALMLVGDIGYGFFLNKPENSRGDMYLNPAVGIRTYLSSQSALTFSVGYLSQSIITQSPANSAQNTATHTDNVSLKVGLMF